MDSPAFYFFVFFSGTLGILMSIEQLLSRNRRLVNYINAGFIFSLSMVQLYHGFMITGYLLKYPHLVLFHAPFVFLVGPMIYFYMKFITDNSFTFRRSHLRHFLPAAFIVLMLLPFYLSSAEVKYRYISYPLGRATDTGLLNVYAVLLFFMLLANLVYLAVFYIKNPFITDSSFREQKKGAFYTCHVSIFGIGISIVTYLAVYIMYAADLFGRETYLELMRYNTLMVGLIIVFIHMLGERYSDLFQELRDEAEKIRYQRSRIEGVDVEDILARLSQAMEEERIYCVEDLTLNMLASELSIAPYQLSQILNERLNKNFNQFINERRIAEACRLLVNEPEKKVSDIALSVGFNSVSVFYSWFLRVNAISPARYRDNHSEKKHS